MKDHLFNIHDIILIMTMSECVLLAVLQNLISTQSRTAHHLLTAFFLLICLNTAGTLILWNEQMQDLNVRGSYMLPLALNLSYMLKGPMLYFYLRSISEPSFSLSGKHLLHLLPIVLGVVTISLFGITGNDLHGGQDEPKESAILYLWTSFKLSPVIYAAVCAFTVRHISDTLLNHYSDVSDIGAGWGNILVVGYLLHWSWSLLTHVIGSDIDIRVSDAFGIVDNYLAFIMINLIFIYSIFYAKRLMAAISPRDSRKKPAAAIPSDSAIDKVNAGINDEKLYLEQNINIEQFARRVGLTSRDVSHAINMHFNSNFFEFINKYRVEEAQRLLASEDHKDATILDILYESGFNSKSAFNRFFKRIAGVSPSEYRNSHLKI